MTVAAAGSALGPYVIGAVAALAGVVITILGNQLTARTASKLERQGRLDDRRTDAYVDLLRFAFYFNEAALALARGRVPPDGPSNDERQLLSARISAYGTRDMRKALGRLNLAVMDGGPAPSPPQVERIMRASEAIVALVRQELGTAKTPEAPIVDAR